MGLRMRCRPLHVYVDVACQCTAGRAAEVQYVTRPMAIAAARQALCYWL
jgi:hypothetical protein